MTVHELNRRTPSPAAIAEAAAWVARLHGPNRTQEVETGLRRWLADDPEHVVAFELLTDTWERSARLQRRPVERVTSWERVGFRISFLRAALASAAITVLAVLGTILFLHSDVVTTGIGELRTLTLDDGTRVHLNTDTRIQVRYDKQLRRVSLERGEALFEVAKRPDWPFVVTAGGREIRALGTAFVVRRDQEDLAVTLVEGRVAVAPLESAIESTRAAEVSSGRPSEQPVVLSPGQRLTFAHAGSPQIDRPPLERVTAWERGQVVLDDTVLTEAVAEMNRYSRQRIVIDDPRAARIRVSGIFEAGDSVNFAQAVGKNYHLKVVQHAREIFLTAAETEPAAPAK